MPGRGGTPDEHIATGVLTPVRISVVGCREPSGTRSMRPFRIFVIALVLLSLQGYVASAIGHVRAPSDVAMAGMESHDMGDCCPGRDTGSTPCDSTHKDWLCGGCQLGHTCKAFQVFLIRVADLCAFLPVAERVFGLDRAEMPPQPPDPLLRPPRVV